MDSQNQFTYFCLSLVLGVTGGVLYEPFSLIRKAFGCGKGRMKRFGAVLDILFCTVFALFCVYAFFLWHFPDFRGYMVVGIGLGFAIYLKILHRMVAFFEKVCYNKIKKLINKVKNTVKKEKNSPKEVKI